MLRGGLQGWHIVVVLVVILLLFGANKLPGLAKSVGESLKIFKKEIKDLSDDATPPAATPPAGPTTPVPPTTTDQGTIPGMVDPNHPKA